MIGRSKLSPLRLALITDDLTRECLAHECKVYNVTPWNYRFVFRHAKPDGLLVESAWNGRWKSWKYGIASYPDRTNAGLARVVEAAREAGIPAVFWNREDGVHFDRFIASARLFDRVLTVDETAVSRYRAELGPDAKIGVMMFAASTAIHRPSDQDPLRRAAFVGSYSSVHPHRKVWQDSMFEATRELGLVIYDRNSSRSQTQYRFPDHPWIEVRRAVPHKRTAEIYRTHAINLNVNTITDSRTAFSRRLVEILACGGYMVTNQTKAVLNLFADYCAVLDEPEEARSLFDRVAKSGLSARQKEQARAGAEYVAENHSWRHRLREIEEILE